MKSLAIKPPHIGALAAGPRNAITDVTGIHVGHATLADGPIQTGVTVMRPHSGDIYRDRVPAAATILNGFGKSIGLMQVAELGVLETPIALTNTFSVPSVAQAQIRQCISANPLCGQKLPTVNPLVFECNDGYLNDLQAMAVTEDHYLSAYAAADPAFSEGSVGAGRGMSSFGLKGGIGSASRHTLVANGSQYTVGTLVLSNFGKPSQLILAGRTIGPVLADRLAAASANDTGEPEKGSIIILIATDAPLDARQLRRLSTRAGAGLARTGSVFGHGSGDIALAFSTAYTLPQDSARSMPNVAMLHDALLDPLFQAVTDGVEQAIIHSLWHAETVVGRKGHRRQAFLELMSDYITTLPEQPQ